MADNRSQKLVGKIFRNLGRHGISIHDILDEEIYDELTKLQDRIIARVNPDKQITLTLKEDVSEYALTTDDASADPGATTYKNNIASVKVVRQPDTFLYPFQIVSNVEYAKLIDGEDVAWTGLASLCAGIQFSSYIKTGVDMLGVKDGVNRTFTIPESITEDSEEIFLNGVLQVRDTDYSIVNSIITFIHDILPKDIAHGSDADDTLVCNYINYSAFGNAIVNTHQPLIGTIIKNRFHVYPTPDSDFDGETIDLISYQKSGQGSVSAAAEPELDNEWDKALEYGVTAEYLEGKARDEYKGYYEKEFEDIKHTVHMKRSTIQRASAFEGRQNERNWY